MAKPKNIDLTEDGVITQQALLAYAEGRLSEPERVQLDKLLKDDPFAQDALEGLLAAAKPAEIGAVITSINSQLRERTGMKERKKKGIEIHWANYAYAAMVFTILIGVGYVLIHIYSGNNKELAQNTPKAQESIPVPEEKKPEPPKMDSTKADTTISQNADSTSNSIGTLKDTITSTDISTAKKNVKAENKVTKEALPVTPTITTNAVGETAAQLDVAKAYFEAADYANAEKKYNEILKAQPGNADALYFGGVSSYLNGSAGFGEANFDKLSKSGFYPDGTKWYKANILLKKGKKDQAKPLIRDLINSNSMFKDRAVKVYEELFK
jgi:tetratricopeptide (TPR) repeat protein